MGGGMDMIKGPLTVKLMSFSNQVGFISSKGYLKNLSTSDVVPLLNDVIFLLGTALDEPSFSRESVSIMWEYGSAKSFKETISGKGTRVIRGDEKQLIMEKAQYWYDLIYKQLGNRLFSTLSEDSVTKLFPSEITDKMDPEARDDIQDGIWCLLYSLPTPAAMVLFRTAERESRKYYTRITGVQPPKYWYDLIEDMRKNKSAPQSILSYMDFIRTKRNEAEHPERRYTQEQSEGIMQQLSFLLKEVYR